jgi:predicted nucleic acid-binding protein
VTILDTNIVSEGFRPIPNPAVLSWINAQGFERLYICSPVLAEIRFDIALLQPGRRRARLNDEADLLEYVRFKGRILSFDAKAAAAYGDLAAARRRGGRPIELIDGFIAAIAMANNADIATRDVYGFSELGLNVINPFEFKP